MSSLFSALLHARRSMRPGRGDNFSDTEGFPTINLFANSGSYNPTSTSFVSEPAVEVYRSADFYQLSCVARIGTDSVIRYPGTNVTGLYTSGGLNSCLMAGDKMLVTYLSENTEEGLSPNGYRPRYAWLDFAPKQPQFSFAPGGAALIAGALPACWDSREITEHSPLRAPVITVANSGAGSAWSGTGVTYLFAAVLTWRDSTGRIHRSAPSNVTSLTGTGVTPYISVYVGKAYRRTEAGGSGGASHEWAEVTIYVSEPNGLVLYAQNYPIASYWTWNAPTQPVVSAFNPPIYTDGAATSELPAYCPNAIKHRAVVADREWALDAERNERAWYTKPIVPGFAPEYNPDQYVDFPASAGTLTAVVDWNGSPLFLTTTGMWTVQGEGPDALLRPPLFGAPAQVGDVPCTQAASVRKTAAGIFWVSNNRFVLFTDGPRFENGIDALAYGSIVGTALFREQQEACFFTRQGYAWVYNWQVNGWSLWDPTVTGVTSLVACAQVPTTGKVLLYGDNGELWALDPATVSTTAQIQITTGWIQLGGAHDRNNAEGVILHARRAGAHGLRVEIAVDFNASNINTKTWTASEIANCVADPTSSLRYDIYAEPRDKTARAVQLTITETDAVGEAFQGIHCTLEVIKQSQKDLRGSIGGASARK